MTAELGKGVVHGLLDPGSRFFVVAGHGLEGFGRERRDWPGATGS